MYTISKELSHIKYFSFVEYRVPTALRRITPPSFCCCVAKDNYNLLYGCIFFFVLIIERERDDPYIKCFYEHLDRASCCEAAAAAVLIIIVA